MYYCFDTNEECLVSHGIDKEMVDYFVGAYLKVGLYRKKLGIVEKIPLEMCIRPLYCVILSVVSRNGS